MRHCFPQSRGLELGSAAIAMTTESANPRNYVMELRGLPYSCKMAAEEREPVPGPQPSEQEEREWEEEKRIRERISHIMGQYLLKGYRMLNFNCTDCGVHSKCTCKLTLA